MIIYFNNGHAQQHKTRSRSELSYETLSVVFVLQRSSRCHRNIATFFFFNILVQSMDILHSQFILGEGGQLDAKIVMMILREGDGL